MLWLPQRCAPYHSRDTPSFFLPQTPVWRGLSCWTASFPRAQPESRSRLPTGPCAEPVVTQSLCDGSVVCLHGLVPWDLLVSVFSCLSANIEGSDFQSVVPKPVSPTSLGNWLEMHTLRPESDALWTEPSLLYVNKPLGDLITQGERTTAVGEAGGWAVCLPLSWLFYPSCILTPVCCLSV